MLRACGVLWLTVSCRALGGPLQARAQEAAADDYLVETWGVDDGLAPSTVSSMAQTPDGYLWGGTHHGGLGTRVRFVASLATGLSHK